jgi:peptide/nickel transport system substrate-binding protein
MLKGAGAAGVAAGTPLALMPSFAQAFQDATPVTGGTLTFGSSAPPNPVISPLSSLGGGQIVLFEPLFMRLVYGRKWGDGINPDPEQTELELGVAKSITEVMPDQAWEFEIRDDVLWHDGTPLTVDDVIFGIWLSLNKNSGATNETPVVGIKGGEALRTNGAAVGDISVEGATKIGEYGLRIELDAPIPNYWVNWGVGYWPYPKHLYGDMPFEELWSPPHSLAPVGNGPFKLSNYVDGQYAEMVANEDFFLGRPLLDKLVIRFGDPDTLTAALESGEIDGTIVTAGPVLDRLSTLDFLVPSIVPATHPFGLVFNWERWPDHAGALGRAVWHAIDMDTLNNQLYSGTLRPGTSLFAHVTGLETPPEGAGVLDYDPDAARAVLEEAGWDANTELQWTMWSPPSAAQDAIQAMLAEVGIKTVYNQIDVATVVDQLYREGNYDLVQANFGPYQSMRDNWKYLKCGWFYDEGGFNYSRYCNEEIDALWQSALDEPDFQKQIPIWNEIQVMFAENPAQATLYRQSICYLWNERVQGAYPYQYRLPVRGQWERVWVKEAE